MEEGAGGTKYRTDLDPGFLQNGSREGEVSSMTHGGLDYSTEVGPQPEYPSRGRHSSLWGTSFVLTNSLHAYTGETYSR